MSRWRNSLATLRHAASIGSHPQASISSSHSSRGLSAATSNAAAVPDFLAPSLHRRHAGSYARAILHSPAYEIAEHSTADTTSASSYSLSRPSGRASRTQTSRRAQRHASGADFSAYFDANGSTPPLSSVETEADIRAHLLAATDESDLARIAKAIFSASTLCTERQRVASVCRSDDGSAHAVSLSLHLNEALVLHLADSSGIATRRSGRSDPLLMNQLITKYLRLLCKAIPHHAFSDSFLTSLARKAGEANPRPTNTALTLLLSIFQHRLSYKAPGKVSLCNDEECAHRQSQALHHLMSGFLRSGHFDQVQACFDLLIEHLLPATVHHHQLRLIAMFRKRTSNLSSKHQADIDRESQQVHAQILQTRTSMRRANLILDDTFLATVLHGLSAPLRPPLAAMTSPTQKQTTLRMVRIAFRNLNEADQNADVKHSTRFTSTLIDAEIDAIESDSGFNLQARAKTIDWIQHLIRRLKAESARDSTSTWAVAEGKTFTEAQVACIRHEIRLRAMLGDTERCMFLLRRLLSLKPKDGIDAVAPRGQELASKQRSSVINLFSSAMHRRHGAADKQNTAFEVLKLAFSSKCFQRVWSGASASMPDGSDDADDAVLRLWKRWMFAWSADCLAEGRLTRELDDNLLHKAPSKALADDVRRGKYHTFTGSRPWQTLKQSLVLLNRVIDQYESLHARVATEETTASRAGTVHSCVAAVDGELEKSPPPAIASLSQLFNDRGVLDTIIKYCLRGGRPPRGETMQTHVERRLSLLVNTLTRVHVNARTWELVESSLLRHLALIPTNVLPTSAVAPTVDLIERRKHAALLRDPKLRQALRDTHPSSLKQEETVSGVGLAPTAEATLRLALLRTLLPELTPTFAAEETAEAIDEAELAGDALLIAEEADLEATEAREEADDAPDATACAAALDATDAADEADDAPDCAADEADREATEAKDDADEAPDCAAEPTEREATEAAEDADREAADASDDTEEAPTSAADPTEREATDASEEADDEAEEIAGFASLLTLLITELADREATEAAEEAEDAPD
ncbi:hypothetical protein PHSY_002471 [Pseudozyma hubeiensis SY62]|uniref:Uncharacterized protein n=1 Tax=Pseudozyma hubeiensis (strain SY62) TaxID=1305764 RepID=R9P0Y0_PSEHS|nr:hypothetical protein PHSY_002471 [Pseudozyma hubeiensis SY62]GAC94898.1 hypothetical protein PHSY_002471 [Pseudozyma hubeiensis SY62]